MKLIYKRILILFSVALNVGFVIMAGVLAYHHGPPFRGHSGIEIAAMVQRLKLPEAQESAVLDTIEQFRAARDAQDKDLKQARDNIIRLLASAGPLDRKQLHALIEAAEHQEKRKSRVFEAHVLQLRDQLGDEKGALYFTFLLEHLKAGKQRPHR